MTPFERNLEVWRQLWRVVERSDVVVQIVDARNPLLFRCEDLESYVKELDGKKRCILLLNKSDLLSAEQRLAWANYFDKHNIEYVFWSAHAADPKRQKAKLHEQEAADQLSEDGTDDSSIPEIIDSDPSFSDYSENNEVEDSDEVEDDSEEANGHTSDSDSHSKEGAAQPVATVEEQKRLYRARVLDPLELLALFENLGESLAPGRRVVIGMVGYPNVGKSSTINVLVGTKKVAVGATPGKTKHFQTLLIGDSICLCDCPGLVFPSFATTKAELVCCGVLPIDQLKDHMAPCALVCRRVPRPIFEVSYGITIMKPAEEEDANRPPTAPEVLRSLACTIMCP